jgi:hypothetical protein
MLVHACNPSYSKAEEEDQEFKASLGKVRETLSQKTK